MKRARFQRALEDQGYEEKENEASVPERRCFVVFLDTDNRLLCLFKVCESELSQLVDLRLKAR